MANTYLVDVDLAQLRAHRSRVENRPLSDEELSSKFLRNARMRLETRAARRALTKLQRIENIEKIETLTSALQTP